MRRKSKNEYGVSLDSNGYAPSIVSLYDDCCYCCYAPETARHEIFGGANRQKSKRLGLWVNLCPRCHERIHNNADSMAAFHRLGQRAATREYGWTREDCIREIGKNYLEDEDEDESGKGNP